MKYRQRVPGILTVVVLIIIAISASVLIHDSRSIGEATAVYRGVPVYYNGVVYSKSHGKHFARDGYYYGQKWQCVEFVKRFYHDALDHKMPEVFGHAKDFFEPSLRNGALNRQRGLVQYRNDEHEAPKPNDIVVFGFGRYGHAAIITKVDEKSVTIIQQNIYGKPKEKLRLSSHNGRFSLGSGKQAILGWLRKPSRAGHM